MTDSFPLPVPPRSVFLRHSVRYSWSSPLRFPSFQPQAQPSLPSFITRLPPPSPSFPLPFIPPKNVFGSRASSHTIPFASLQFPSCFAILYFPPLSLSSYSSVPSPNPSLAQTHEGTEWGIEWGTEWDPECIVRVCRVELPLVSRSAARGTNHGVKSWSVITPRTWRG